LAGNHLVKGNLLLESQVAYAGVTFLPVQVAVEGEGTSVGNTDSPLRFDVDRDGTDEQLATLLKPSERYCASFQTLRTLPQFPATVRRTPALT
jgi:hypothetical protein